MPAALQSGVSPHLVLSRSTAVGPVGGSAWRIKAAAVSGSVSAEFGVTGV